MPGFHYDCPTDMMLDHVACSSAFSDADLFHRDVSFGNIMIGLDDEGRLNDWDLCRGVNVDKSLEGPRTVRERSHMTALVFIFVYRGPGNSYLPDYSQTPGRSIR